jgi:hypothetical protein
MIRREVQSIRSIHFQLFAWKNKLGIWVGDPGVRLLEPESYALLLSGLALIGFMARRKVGLGLMIAMSAHRKIS